MASPSSLKRSLDDAGLDDLLQASTDSGIADTSRPTSLPPSHVSANCASSLAHPSRSRETSPPPSSTGSITRDDSAPPLKIGAQATVNASKRRKVTATEKEAKRLEKQEKDGQRAKEKAKKLEEKRVKDVEKEEKKKAKEAERHLKDEEKRKREVERKAKEDEKAKKEKSQLRLNSFFSRPADPAAGSSRSPCNERGDPLSSRRSSIVSIDGVESLQSSRASSTSPKDVQGSDYERNFPCFFLQSHTSLAPHNRFFGDEGVASACHKIDKGLEINSTSSTHSAAENPHFDFRELVHSSPHKRSRRPRRYLSVKDIVGRIHGTVDNPIDLSVSKTGTPTQRSVDMLKAVSTKYLRFAEDVRPPYIGTYTKIPPGQSMTRLCRNPFSRSLPSTNYDYDSEAEWEEPGEGEDLDSEGEEELGEDDDADDMEGFLDDDDAGDGLGAASNKRRHIMGDLEPVCTGLCWEGAQTGKIPVSEPRQATIDMRPFKLEVILEKIQLPINPFSTSYWQHPNDLKTIAHSPKRPLATSMNPPRVPLHIIDRTNPIIPGPLLFPNLHSKPSNPSSSPAKPPSLPKRIIPPDLMDDFKKAIQGSDLTKAGLVEILKKQFPKASKDAIKDTLGLVAQRVGIKEADKVWVLRDTGAGMSTDIRPTG
ncbi:hypothetical protein MMC24_006413 [Lignoscripta atroalba]|nr:hypothetical protein [Lignoscripta atroalba]